MSVLIFLSLYVLILVRELGFVVMVCGDAESV